MLAHEYCLSVGLVGLDASPGILHADCSVAAQGGGGGHGGRRGEEGVCMTGLAVLTDESHPVSLTRSPAVACLLLVLLEDSQEHVPADQSE